MNKVLGLLMNEAHTQVYWAWQGDVVAPFQGIVEFDESPVAALHRIVKGIKKVPELPNWKPVCRYSRGGPGASGSVTYVFVHTLPDQAFWQFGKDQKVFRTVSIVSLEGMTALPEMFELMAHLAGIEGLEKPIQLCHTNLNCVDVELVRSFNDAQGACY